MLLREIVVDHSLDEVTFVQLLMSLGHCLTHLLVLLGEARLTALGEFVLPLKSLSAVLRYQGSPLLCESRHTFVLDALMRIGVAYLPRRGQAD